MSSQTWFDNFSRDCDRVVSEQCQLRFLLSRDSVIRLSIARISSCASSTTLLESCACTASSPQRRTRNACKRTQRNSTQTAFLGHQWGGNIDGLTGRKSREGDRTQADFPQPAILQW